VLGFIELTHDLYQMHKAHIDCGDSRTHLLELPGQLLPPEFRLGDGTRQPQHGHISHELAMESARLRGIDLRSGQ